MRYFSDKRGAALVEYAILTALIAVGAIAGVSQLGSRVATSFEDIAGDLSSAIKIEDTQGEGAPSANEESSPWGDPMPTGAWTSWISTTSKWNWTIDLTELKSKLPEGTQLYWDASFATSGRMTPQTDNANGHFGYGIESFWVRPGTDYPILRGGVEPLTPESDEKGVTTEYAYSESHERGTVRDEVTGIRLGRSYYSCGFQSACESDDVHFEIRLYSE